MSKKLIKDYEKIAKEAQKIYCEFLGIKSIPGAVNRSMHLKIITAAIAAAHMEWTETLLDAQFSKLIGLRSGARVNRLTEADTPAGKIRLLLGAKDASRP